MTEQNHEGAGGVSTSNAGLAMTDTEADAAQNWKGMDGAIAYHLIDRHADGWADVGTMMNAWLRANGGTLANAQGNKPPTTNRTKDKT